MNKRQFLWFCFCLFFLQHRRWITRGIRFRGQTECRGIRESAENGRGFQHGRGLITRRPMRP